jgi:nucleotide-binding universal stress UspA family protein
VKRGPPRRRAASFGGIEALSPRPALRVRAGLAPPWRSYGHRSAGLGSFAAMLSVVAVGTDGSATASKAVDAAAEIARRFGAKLVLLSAAQRSRDPLAGFRESSEELQWAANKSARLRTMLDRTEQYLRDRKIDCTTMLDEGDPAEVLVRLAEECDADLLVIGNRGMHRRVLGSVPNTVTHKARCSVYVVKTT